MKNPIDWLVAMVNPRAGVARAAARKMLRGFEAADRGRRTAGWRTHSTDADSEIRQGQRLLRDRARSMRRDNPYAERGISAISTNVVGYGIVPDPRGRARQKKKALELWQKWAETTACDTEAMSNFYGVQLLAMQTVVESGEVLIRRKWTPGKNVLNFQLQIFEPDFLDNSRDYVNADGGYIQDGIEFNAAGEKTGYWLFPHHPGQARVPLMQHVSKFVPAEDVIHMFFRKRPGQMRGYTWLAPVMLRMRNFDEMEDAVIEQAKIAACFAAFIHADDDTSLPGTPNATEREWEHIEPGAINRLSGNENITFGTPPTFNGYDAYSRQSLRATAVGLGIPYEVLTGDLSGVSFTSGRMGWLEFGRNIDVWRWQMIIPQLCDRVWHWFNEAAMLSAGGFPEPIACGWVAPRRDLIDPTKELQALSTEMRIGALSYTGMLKERGINDTAAHVQQIVEDNKLIDDSGLVLDSDPRKVSNAGLTQARPSGTELPSTDIAPSSAVE